MKRSRKVFSPVFGLAVGIFIAFIPTLRAPVVIPIQVIPANVLDLPVGNLGNGMSALESNYAATNYGSNDLWLEIAMTNSTTALTIHYPATNANGVYDLYFETNLVIPNGWEWLLRCAPGQTNLAVSNLPPARGFFMLSVTNAIRAGFDDSSLPPEDDSPSTETNLPFTVNFFGTAYSNLWVNNNGNVTFDSAEPEYKPIPLSNFVAKIIAPFWADVDTRSVSSDVVKFGSGVVDGHDAFGVDWVNVGYYFEHADKLLSCQLVIIDRSDIAPGDFDVEFNYDKVEWEWGDASGGYPPRAGYSDGVNGYELPGSGVEGAFLDSNPATGLKYHNSNSSVPGRYRFFFRDGEPEP